jgi:uncharacterized paraquat-inducible protein A
MHGLAIGSGLKLAASDLGLSVDREGSGHMNTSGAQAVETLRNQGGGPWRVIPLLLLVSFGLNLAALFVPFLILDVLFKPSSVLGLPGTVHMLWEAKLYIVALLVAAFSLVFPFIKLLSMAWIWYLETDKQRRKKLLSFVHTFGKWSMLDVFVVVLVLVLTDDQRFIHARTQYGLFLFILAIALSMTAALLMESLLRKVEPDPMLANGEQMQPALIVNLNHPFLVVIFMLLGLFAFLAAIGLPFLQVDQVLLKANAYSVLDTIETLWIRGTPGLSIFVALTLVGFVLLGYVGRAGFLLLRMKIRHRLRLQYILQEIEAWIMLDVFVLALVVFLIEGHRILSTKVERGTFYLPTFLFLAYLLYIVAIRLDKQSRKSR